MLVRRLVVGPFAENSYVFGDPATREGALVDPGGEVDALLAIAADHRFRIGKILLTHAHVDHVAGAAEARRRTGAPTYLHPGEKELLEVLPQQTAMFGLPDVEKPEIDRWIREGTTLEVGTLKFETRLVPGHSPGHLVYVAQGAVFCGDTVFEGSIGRTDILFANPAVFLPAIRKQLLTLPDETVLYPGHMAATTVGRERLDNPFLNGEAA
jgi:glyoxylase-like metal-dependent hydrolase (beta-lactamase superfamily II)